MRVSFRQGIIQYQLPTFLNVGPSFVSLVVTNTPLVITVAHQTKDYLLIEQASIANAWTISPGVDQWLYIDIDQFTGVRTFGKTLISPAVQSNAPAPVLDKHWFNTSTTTMFVRVGSRWQEKIRVFVCMLAGGTVPISVSIQSNVALPFAGTQVGITGSFLTGQIVFDGATLDPLRTPNKLFITTEDELTTRTIITSKVKIASVITEAAVNQPMAAYTIVRFFDYGNIEPADAFTAAQQLYGIIEQDVVTGIVVNVATDGTVSNPIWDFSVAGGGVADFVRFPTPTPVNGILYSNATGQLTSVAVIPNQTGVAIVIDKQTILMKSVAPVTTGSGTTPLATDGVHGKVRLNIPAAVVTDPVVIGANDPRMTYLNNVTSDIQAQIDAISGTSSITKINNDTVTLIPGTPIYSSGVGFMARASAAAPGTSIVLGFVTQAAGVPSASAGSIQTEGPLPLTIAQWNAVTGGVGGLVEGALYFLDATTPGKITTTAPTTTGQSVVTVGVAINATILSTDVENPILV